MQIFAFSDIRWEEAGPAIQKASIIPSRYSLLGKVRRTTGRRLSLRIIFILDLAAQFKYDVLICGDLGRNNEYE
jgi:hypothetical protein